MFSGLLVRSRRPPTGPIAVTRDGVAIQAGMDAFIWRSKRPHCRPNQAFAQADYSQEEWKVIFPDGKRRLLDDSSCPAVAYELEDQ